MKFIGLLGILVVTVLIFGWVTILPGLVIGVVVLIVCLVGLNEERYRNARLNDKLFTPNLPPIPIRIIRAVILVGTAGAERVVDAVLRELAAILAERI